MRILVVLPAYNEENGLPQLLDSLTRHLFTAGSNNRLVIVDDGSTDGTLGVIEKWSTRLPIELVRHKTNRGLGETVRDGLLRALELAQADDVIVTMDADNTHSPVLIAEMLLRLEEGHDLVIASRYRPGAAVLGLSRFRHWLSDGARLLFQLGAPIPGVRDYTCGFRAYRAAVLEQAFALYKNELITERGFACMAEILLKLQRLRIKACEVPMILRYDLKGGASKMRVARTVFRTLRLLARYRFTRV